VEVVFLVVLFLVTDVSLDGFDGLRAHGNSPVSFLPPERATAALAGPPRGAALDVLKNLGEGGIRAKAQQKVDVIGDSASLEQCPRKLETIPPM
jgi:hypothetical protein